MEKEREHICNNLDNYLLLFLIQLCCFDTHNFTEVSTIILETTTAITTNTTCYPCRCGLPTYLHMFLNNKGMDLGGYLYVTYYNLLLFQCHTPNPICKEHPVGKNWYCIFCYSDCYHQMGSLHV